MLETEEVDDDYFTPVASTSLANIFGNNTQHNEEKLPNESLKYTPPKQQSATAKPEDLKSTECIYACALVGYEWFENVYSPKGKLGFAIIKMLKTGSHNIVLYDSNKTTLSCTVISTNLDVTINSNHICYYDNLKKYWSLYATENEIKKIIDILNTFDITLKHTSHTDNESPDCSKIENKTTPLSHEPHLKKDIGSDTDSSINRKTKISIMNRMANMGHSVLPTHTNTHNKDRASDSSDTNDSIDHTKVVRHKPVKNVLKKINPEKNIVLSQPQHMIETQHKIIMPKIDHAMESNSLYTYGKDIIVPIKNSNIMTSSSSKISSDMDFFMTEQRVNNSEVRININRITDKVDHILDKINNLDQKDKSINITTNLQNEIMEKLLREYENKIKLYEEMLKRESHDNKLLTDKEAQETHGNNENEIQNLKYKIEQLEQINTEKDSKISNLHGELHILNTNLDMHVARRIKEEDEYLKITTQFEQKLANKNQEIVNLTNRLETLSVINDQCGVGDKIKNIMNDTYQTLAANFEYDKEYSGETIKKIIAVVIKKVTLEAIQENK